MKTSLRSLFHKKEQAPSFQAPPDDRLLPQTRERLDKLLRAWIDGKGYRMPDKTIEAAAIRIGTDSATLYRYFSARGEDFRTFRAHLRLEDAKQLLLEEADVPAAVIGKRVGFSDRGNFSHQFSAYTGFTPDGWRKQFLQK